MAAIEFVGSHQTKLIPSSLRSNIPTMSANRFPFTVYRAGDDAVVTMNYDGFVRARNMPAAFLTALVDVCTQIRCNVIDVLKQDAEALSRLPAFPRCAQVASGDLGPCLVRVTASLEVHGPEFTTAFYDEGDDEAPVLILVDEQIEEFVAKAQEVSDAIATL